MCAAAKSFSNSSAGAITLTEIGLEMNEWNGMKLT